MCLHLGVSRSGFYARQQRPVSDRARNDAALQPLIAQAHEQSRLRYGSPRVTKLLHLQGHAVGRGRVARLMRLAGLQGHGNHLFRRKGRTLDFFSAVPNTVRGQAITRVDQLWVGDVTYIKVAGQWRYLAVVMDRFSRRVLGWSLGHRRTATLTIAALKQALKSRRPPSGTYFHSDRGVEYGSRAFKDELKRHGFIQSMNRPGSMNDNAHMESFFHSLKIEGLYKQRFDADKPLRASLQSYFHFYNHQRLHSSLLYRSPAAFESMHLTQPTVHKIQTSARLPASLAVAC
jgi:putative transposase